MCKNLMDEIVVLRKEGWLIVKMNGWYVQIRVGVIL